MTVLSISADMAGAERLVAGLGQPLDIRWAREPLIAFYVGREKMQFAKAPWRKLSTRYAKAKEKEYPGEGILRRTEALYEGLTQPEVAEFSQDTAVIGVRTGVGRSPLYYAQFAQQGRGEPKRTVMPGLTSEERAEVVDIVRMSVIERVLSAGR